MWLTNVEHVWDASPDDDIPGAELALVLLGRTRLLLQDGDRWRGNHLAIAVNGKACDPLSPKAFYYSLVGAALKARWAMREDVADSEVNPVHIQQLMTTLLDFEKRYRGETHGWTFVDAFLEGLQSALSEYVIDRKSQRSRDSQAA